MPFPLAPLEFPPMDENLHDNIELQRAKIVYRFEARIYCGTKILLAFGLIVSMFVKEIKYAFRPTLTPSHG